jgi:hypothetical protein
LAVYRSMAVPTTSDGRLLQLSNAALPPPPLPKLPAQE